MDLSIILEITRKHTKEILTIFITPVLIGVIASLMIDNQYTSSATVSPKRSSAQDSGSGVGVIAAFAGIEDEKLSPELKFATNYFYSYQFLSGFLIAHDLVDDMLMFQKYDKKCQKIDLEKLFEACKSIFVGVHHIFLHQTTCLSRTAQSKKYVHISHKS
jgi:hypothetical protein